jgi:hypothetical protein
MRLPEDSELVLTDSKHIHDTTASIDKSITWILGLIIFLMWIWYNVIA